MVVREAAEAGDSSALLIRALSHLDERLVEVLRAGDIRLVRVSWLVESSVTRIERRQQLEACDHEECSPLLSEEEAVELVQRGTRCVGAVTYPWLSPGDPDPAGERVKALRQTVLAYPHIEALFWE